MKSLLFWYDLFKLYCYQIFAFKLWNVFRYKVVCYDPLKVGILISPDKKGHHKSSQKSLKRGKLFSQTLHSILIKYRIFGLKNELTPFYNQWGRLEWHGVQHI